MKTIRFTVLAGLLLCAPGAHATSRAPDRSDVLALCRQSNLHYPSYSQQHSPHVSGLILSPDAQRLAACLSVCLATGGSAHSCAQLAAEGIGYPSRGMNVVVGWPIGRPAKK